MGMGEGAEATVIGANILSYRLFLLVLSSGDAGRGYLPPCITVVKVRYQFRFRGNRE